MPLIGEIAGIGTAVLWAANAIFFTEASKRINVLSASILRLILASIILVLLHLVFGGRFSFPVQSLLWLVSSGIVALALGDWFLFAALGKIGPRIVMLVMSLSPVFAALIAWVFLKETLGLMAVAGIILTVGGIGMVALNKKSNEHIERRTLITGIAYSALAAMGQGTGLVLAKQGMSFGVGELDATMIRVVASTVTVAATVVVIGKSRKVVQSVRDAKAMLYVSLGTTVGLIAGTLLAFVAINNTKTGIGAALISISPLILLPISRILYKEKITLVAWSGTIITLAGVILLMLRG